ncbi:hypothetical protein Hanom_Chr17g01579121 [Helianthus anomalus]
MFVRLAKRTKYLVRLRSFIKRTNTIELPAEQLINFSLNVHFIGTLKLTGKDTLKKDALIRLSKS